MKNVNKCFYIIFQYKVSIFKVFLKYVFKESHHMTLYQMSLVICKVSCHLKIKLSDTLTDLFDLDTIISSVLFPA